MKRDDCVCMWKFETDSGEVGCMLNVSDDGRFNLCSDAPDCVMETVYDFIENHMDEFLVDGRFDYDMFTGIMLWNEEYTPIRLKGVSAKSDRLIYNLQVNHYPVTIVSANNGLNYVIR